MPSLRQIGPFELIEKIGAGGMGEVFKARDTRLQRFVALKFLPESANAAARERFQREALAVAALNHPNICVLHEIGEDQGRPYLVLELLEGETLYHRLQRGPASVADLAQWSAEVADALQAAHAKGILHRDLKPTNIFITARGAAKVLDFGLAQFEAPPTGSVADAATLQAGPLTTPGTTLGTLAYMSPEQARGEVTDARSDIFSLGVVAYEMAIGTPPFKGRTALDVSAAILRETPPPPSASRAGLPPLLDGIVARCLEKDPDLRYQSAADLRIEMKRLQRESTAHPAVGSSAIAPAVSASSAVQVPSPSDSQVITNLLRRRWRWPATGAAVIILAAVAWWRFTPRVAAPPQLQFRQLTFSGQVTDAAISPDGKFLALVNAGADGTSLHLMSVLTGSDTQIMPPAPGCCSSPSFSSDGGMVYFVNAATLQAIPVLGGPVHSIATNVCSGAGFSPDGSQIAYLARATGGDTLNLARADGSQARMLSDPRPAGYDSRCWANGLLAPDAPAWSPDGRSIAVDEGGAGASTTDQIVLVPVGGGPVRALGPHLGQAASDLAWLRDGSGLVLTDRNPGLATPQVWEITYPAGRALQLTHDLQGYDRGTVAGNALALLHSAPQYTVWRQAQPGGAFEPIPGGGATEDGAAGLAWTPKREIVSLHQPSDKSQLWIEGGSAPARMLTTDALPTTLASPVVAPDGSIVVQAFGSDAVWHLWRVNPDGSGAANLTPGTFAVDPSLTQGGKTVAFLAIFEEAGKDRQQLSSVPLGGGPQRTLWQGGIYSDLVEGMPDQARVLVMAFNADSPVGTLELVPIAGGAPTPPKLHRPLTWAGGNVTTPYGVTPDGRALTAVVRQGLTDNIWAFPLDASAPFALTHFTDLHIAAYAFAKDGRLAVSRGSQDSDAVLATGLLGSSH